MECVSDKLKALLAEVQRENGPNIVALVRAASDVPNRELRCWNSLAYHVRRTEQAWKGMESLLSDAVEKARRMEDSCYFYHK